MIIGGGIIGSTSAYFLTRHPSYNPAIHKITIIEATKIASAASGKAGGLLALWAYPSSIVPLSYRLHAELAKEHNGSERWGYRKLHCGQLSARGRHLPTEEDAKSGKEWSKLPKRDAKALGRLKRACLPGDLDWFVSDGIVSYEEMGNPSTTAQVLPYHFTTSMAELAQEKGVEVIYGSVTAIDYDEQVRSVTYTAKDTGEINKLLATDVILSAGPWTRTILPEAPVEATRAHSVVIKADVSPYAIFSEITLPSGFGGGKRASIVSPEVYARPDGTVYACGEGDSQVPLPKSSDLVQCDESKCQDVIEYFSSISDEMRDGEILAKQACYLPSVVRGLGGPLIGQTGVKGLLIAAGHTCWGIQNGPGTGKLISEFVFDGKAVSANIGSLDPRSVMDL